MHRISHKIYRRVEMPVVALLFISTIGLGFSENSFALEDNRIQFSENFIMLLEPNQVSISKFSQMYKRNNDFELFSQAPEEVKKIESLKKERPGHLESINRDIKDSVKEDVRKNIREDIKDDIAKDLKNQIRQDIFDSIRPSGGGGNGLPSTN